MLKTKRVKAKKVKIFCRKNFPARKFTQSRVSHFLSLTLACTSGDIRLSGGGVSYEGRVEYCYQSSWGTVCDGGWGTTEAAVVCSQLGYPAQGIHQ